MPRKRDRHNNRNSRRPHHCRPLGGEKEQRTKLYTVVTDCLRRATGVNQPPFRQQSRSDLKPGLGRFTGRVVGFQLTLLQGVSFTRLGALRAQAPEHAESASTNSIRDRVVWRVVSTDTPTSMLPGISRKRKMRSKF